MAQKTDAHLAGAPSLPLGIPDPTVARDVLAQRALSRDERAAVRQWTFVVPALIGAALFALGTTLTAFLVVTLRPAPVDPRDERVPLKAAALDHLLDAERASASTLFCVDVDHDEDVAAAIVARRTSPHRVVDRRLCRHATRTLDVAPRLLMVGEPVFTEARRAVLWASGRARTKLLLEKRDGAGWVVLDEKRH